MFKRVVCIITITPVVAKLMEQLSQYSITFLSIRRHIGPFQLWPVTACCW